MQPDKLRLYLGSCCGNSFIILDCRNIKLDKKEKSEFSVKNIPKYNVDSALFISNEEGFDISMEIFEKDGSESDSCGNGMILISFLLELNMGTIKMKNSVVIVEGNPEKQSISMSVKFLETQQINNKKNCLFVRIGEPHLIYLVNNINEYDLIKTGEEMQKKYLDGINVDAIQKESEYCYLIKTYERGVCDLTKSCGTGSLSSYVAISILENKIYNRPIEFRSLGGSHWISKVGDMLKLETLKHFCEIKKLEVEKDSEYYGI